MTVYVLVAAWSIAGVGALLTGLSGADPYLKQRDRLFLLVVALVIEAVAVALARWG